jgi:hypothetical protein
VPVLSLIFLSISFFCGIFLIGIRVGRWLEEADSASDNIPKAEIRALLNEMAVHHHTENFGLGYRDFIDKLRELSAVG